MGAKATLTKLKGRTGEVVDKIQKVASERVASPIAKRAVHARSRASQARTAVREYMLFMTSLASGIVARIGQNYEEVKNKGMWIWIRESGRAARTEAIAIAGAAKVTAAKLAARAC